MLDANWRPSSEFLTRVFAYSPALPRWRASEFLAHKKLCRTACALGENVPDALPASQACSAWIELARWWIAQCDPEEAITRLDRAIDCAPSSLSFSEPLFAALRARWLLTPESQRAAFELDVIARLRTSKHRRSEIAAAALIASLKGDDSLAAERIAEIVRDRELRTTRAGRSLSSKAGISSRNGTCTVSRGICIAATSPGIPHSFL